MREVKHLAVDAAHMVAVVVDSMTVAAGPHIPPISKLKGTNLTRDSSHPPQWTRIATSAARLRSQQNPESSDRSHHHSCSYTVLLYSCSRHPGTLDWTSLRNDLISRYRRNLQNRNSVAAGIAIRFGPNILLKCSVRQTGPKYPTTTLDDGYKSSFSLNHYVQSLRPAHSRRRVQIFVLTQSLRSIITTGARGALTFSRAE